MGFLKGETITVDWLHIFVEKKKEVLSKGEGSSLLEADTSTKDRPKVFIE